MNYSDFILTRLADETLRSTLFDQAALERILFSAFDAQTMTLESPFAAVFEQLSIGVPVPRSASLEGRWGDISSPQQHEGRFTLQRFGMESTVRVDALWRGAITARVALSTSRIEKVVATWPDSAALDDLIIGELGSLPSSPTELEARRRAALLTRARAGLRQPEVFTESQLDEWLSAVGARDVTDLVTRFRNQLLTGTLQVQFAQSTAEVTPRVLPIVAAILVRDAPLALAALVAESKQVRTALEQWGIERPRAGGDVGTQAIPVVWMVPQAIFDDADWPGAQPSMTESEKNRARQAAAGRWLAREGIALVTTPPRPT